MSEEDRELRKKLEELGIKEVRRIRAKGAYGERKRPIVDEWIAHQERNLSEDALERDFVLREEELGVNRKTRNTAKTAAIVLAIAATISAICAIIALFL